MSDSAHPYDEDDVIFPWNEKQLRTDLDAATVRIIKEIAALADELISPIDVPVIETDEEREAFDRALSKFLGREVKTTGEGVEHVHGEHSDAGYEVLYALRRHFYMSDDEYRMRFDEEPWHDD